MNSTRCRIRQGLKVSAFVYVGRSVQLMSSGWIDLMTFLVREGFIYFFFNDATDGYVMADLFNDE
jgi:hypothetical protein